MTRGILVACAVALSLSSCDDDPLPAGLPIAQAERARELKMLTLPPVERVSRDAYTASQSEAGQGATDARIEYLQNTYGRIGFFPKDYDLRPVQGQTSTFYAAFYSSDEKKITLIGDPAENIVVHELVHALQDQHFDLDGYREEVISSDESLAKSGLVEGDATIAELRHVVTARGYRPDFLTTFVTYEEANRLSHEVLDESPEIAPFFLARVSFSYTYGPAFALNLTGVTDLRTRAWSWPVVNDAFGVRRPHTTRGVLGAEDRVVPVGLTRLPSELAGSYEIDIVDRLGAWYTHLLFYRHAPALSVQTIAAGWAGDQMVVVHRRDTRIGAPNGPSGVIWTSAWTSPTDAASVVEALKALHGLGPTADDASGRSWVSKDGEPVWLETRDALVTFVKNIPSGDARIFADRALQTPVQQNTLAVHRRVLDAARRFPCPSVNFRDRGARP